LRRECSVFTRYLTSREPDEYLLGKYLALQERVSAGAPPRARIDAALLAVARRGVTGTRIADAYARFFRPQGELRRKLVLVLAIAENSRGFHRALTTGSTGPRLLRAVSVAASLAAFGLALFAGLLLFTPFRFLPSGRPNR
jgi:hypothetical protein